MLGLILCTGRSAHIEDYTFAIASSDSSPPRKKGSLSSGKRKIAKLEIGAPSDFRHESHMGYEEVATLAVDKYSEHFHMKVNQAQATSPTSTVSHSREFGRTPSSPRSQVKRKPVPPTPFDDANAIASPARTRSLPPLEVGSLSSTGPSSRAHRSSASQSLRETSSHARSSQQQRYSPPASSTSSSFPAAGLPPKTLVPLFGESSADAPYVTQTAKLRWDGAMAEIERALKETNRQ